MGTMTNSTAAWAPRLAFQAHAANAMPPLPITASRIARPLASSDGASRAASTAQLLPKPTFLHAQESQLALPHLAWTSFSPESLPDQFMISSLDCSCSPFCDILHGDVCMPGAGLLLEFCS